MSTTEADALMGRLRDWADATYVIQPGELPAVRRDLAAAADALDLIRALVDAVRDANAAASGNGDTFHLATEAQQQAWARLMDALEQGAGPAPRWWHCDTHGAGKLNAWGCPDCVAELRRWRSTHAPRLDALQGLLATAQVEAHAGMEAVATLASERAANAMLSDEVERLRARIEAAPLALMDPREALSVCALDAADFPALYAMRGRRVRLLDEGPMPIAPAKPEAAA